MMHQTRSASRTQCFWVWQDNLVPLPPPELSQQLAAKIHPPDNIENYTRGWDLRCATSVWLQSVMAHHASTMLSLAVPRERDVESTVTDLYMTFAGRAVIRDPCAWCGKAT